MKLYTAGYVTWACLVALTTACGRDAPQESSDPAADASGAASASHPLAGQVVYTCRQRPPFTVRFAKREAEVDLSTTVITLPQVMTASGAKYEWNSFSFWSKGSEATLKTPDGSDECRGTEAKTPWEAARLRGATFRALGQEPGWALEIVPGRWIHLRNSYGEQNLVVPVPEAATTDAGKEYRSQSESHRLNVLLRDAQCQDVMSGESFPITVVVELDGSKLEGCGRPW